MSRARVILVTAITIGLVGVIAGAGTFAAFSSTSGNGGNAFAAGTVTISDNDAGGALLSLSNARPGNAATGCIQITYGGSLDAGVRIYGATTGGIAPYLTLTVTQGSTGAAFNSCAGFTPGPVVYSGVLSSFPTSYASGLVDPDPTWTTAETHAYQFVITLNSDPAAQGLSGTASFTWEARNL